MWFVVLGIFSGILFIVYTLRPTNSQSVAENDFSSYIIKDVTDTPTRKPKQDKYHPVYCDPGCQVLILYGTEYGFSEELAKILFDKVCSISSNRGGFQWQPRLVNAKDFQCVDFNREQLCCVVISTSGDGVPPTEAKAFYTDLMGRTGSLDELKFCVLALGDSNYPQFCKTGITVHNRIESLGAVPLLPCQTVDMEDWDTVYSWMDQVLTSLSTVDLRLSMDYLQLPLDDDAAGYNRHRPFMATLKKKKQLTCVKYESDKETIHCEFDISDSGLSWTSGDAVGIYPRNNSSVVKRLLACLKFSATELVKTPQFAYEPKTDDIPLRDALLHYYDIKHVQPGLLVALLSCVRDTAEKEILQNLLIDGRDKKNAALEDYLKDREVIDILESFHSIQLKIHDFLSNLRPLQPRYYSVASSPMEDPQTVCVTAAVIRYKTLGRHRTGVTTTFLQDGLDIGETCPLFMSINEDFRLPSNKDVPVILIGPGTGIAPFRAFIQEREKMRVSGCQTYLYFGCRHKMKDFLYRDELERWRYMKVINLRVAFSRDGEQKVYVQHLLMQDGHHIWRLVDQKTAHVYVCGDVKHMAHDVHQTLLKIVCVHGHMSEEDAAQYLKTLEAEGRYQKDVWVT